MITHCADCNSMVPAGHTCPGVPTHTLELYGADFAKCHTAKLTRAAAPSLLRWRDRLYILRGSPRQKLHLYVESDPVVLP